MTRLRRTPCDGPGIVRIRRGKGFEYRDAAGSRVTDPEALDRISALAIPPAWTDVWICPVQNGHLQAVGTDAAQRRQYLYHQAWRERKDAIKHDRAIELAQVLPEAREAAGRQMKARRFTRERALATAFTILDQTSIRVGSEQYAVRYATYGLATLLREHATASVTYVDLNFRGKGSQLIDLHVRDRRVARVVRELLDRDDTAPELFAWQDAEAVWRCLSSSDVNSYISELTGGPFTAKDFRTWNATVLMAIELAKTASEHDELNFRLSKQLVKNAVERVSEYLGNTPAIARASYIDRRIIDLFNDRVVVSLEVANEPVPAGRMFSANAERAVAEMLRNPRKADRQNLVDHLEAG